MYSRHPNQVSHLNFQNLSLFDPFIINGFLYLDVLFTRFNYSVIYLVSQVGSAIIFGWLSVDVIRKIKNGEADYFSHLVLITSLCVMGFLAALSIYYPKDARGSFVWTYVTEVRYFAPAVFLIIFYLLKNLNFKAVNRPLRFTVSVFVVASIVFTLLLGVYYLVTNNTAGSFYSLYGKIFRVNEFVESKKNNQTYFISLSNHPPTDSETTSLVAVNGTKVAINYYKYFPDSIIAPLFSKSTRLPAGKKIIVFLDKNVTILDSINLTNRHTIEQNSEGEKFLVINN
jgi:hypothetical protein